MSARERAAQAVEEAETALDANQNLARRAEHRPVPRQPDFAGLAKRRTGRVTVARLRGHR